MSVNFSKAGGENADRTSRDVALRGTGRGVGSFGDADQALRKELVDEARDRRSISSAGAS